MAKELERIYTSEKQEKIGEVRIADEVVAIIAGLAATEVEGVAAMAGNATREIIERMGMKSLSKGVSVEVIDSTVSVKLSLNLEYGHSIPEVCAKVQERVKSAIENMTGLEVLDVNITIAGVNIDQ
ncbi:MAG TPA: Asp23/Gls24 family envelope stress response protein [Candidatus Fimimorpha faecalis]|uniref:Asp23/Gls24 family envelope stress response protein n=1 Tax=Candidatus Fimimorpha faecalis TaxID=2840824 RepID=A0A9D1EG60_9FIRM|nr:Asp23/Gls24 family envelope stress response protein [Candidatus Fimimorpha faecalis]